MWSITLKRIWKAMLSSGTICSGMICSVTNRSKKVSINGIYEDTHVRLTKVWEKRLGDLLDYKPEEDNAVIGVCTLKMYNVLCNCLTKIITKNCINSSKKHSCFVWVFLYCHNIGMFCFFSRFEWPRIFSFNLYFFDNWTSMQMSMKSSLTSPTAVKIGR